MTDDDKTLNDNDLARALLQGDVIGHDEIASMLERDALQTQDADPLRMAAGHRRAAELLREMLA